MLIYNTLTSSKEEFHKDYAPVRMYVCGITVYDYCHIGHARSSVVFDMIRRTLKWLGMNVIFVKNFTDIDDKIINKANSTGESWREIAAKFIKAHDEDMEKLNILPPDHTPKATDYINEMIGFCRSLIEKGHAYEKNGDLYYRVSSFDEYGKLSRKNTDDLRMGARVDVNEQKESPLDFALWKSAKPGEPFWESPWGSGRPGWHLECSVMNKKLLGNSIDIHGGGQDLIFPHHENEIAQSEAVNGEIFVRLWMHNGFVNINQEKMSKSLGNFFTIRDILKIANGEVLRFFLLSTHYRQPLEYANIRLLEAENSLERIYFFKNELEYAASSKKGAAALKEIETLRERFDSDFKSALSDDFNTPLALSHIFEFVRAGNKLLAEKLQESSLERLRLVSSEIFDKVSEVLGICGRSPHEWFKSNLSIPEQDVKKAILERLNARKDKNFALADEIRSRLLNHGIELLDTANGTRYITRRVRQS